MKRRPPTADEKVAALLLAYWDKCGDPIPFDVAKQMTAEEICSLVQWHHSTPHTWAATNHPTVLVPMHIMEHREVTKKQAPVLAKVRKGLKKRQQQTEGCGTGCTMTACAYTPDGRCRRLARPSLKRGFGKRS